MSKADEKSKQYRDFREQCGIKDPVMLNEIEVAYYEGYLQAEKDLTDKAKVSSGWDGFYYGQGYKQAEKDNELTWEDIQKIDVLIYAVLDEEKYKRYYTQDRDGDFYEEVLKRFLKERKEK